MRLDELERRVRELETEQATMAERMQGSVARHGEIALLVRELTGEIHKLRIEFTKLSTKVLLVATLLGPIMFVAVSEGIKKLIP